MDCASIIRMACSTKQYLDRLQLFHRLMCANRDRFLDMERRRTRHCANAFRFLDQPLYVVVEKILAENEEIPLDWQTCGTTGLRIHQLS
jgi:maltooligosyltrehalose synthase